MNLLQSPDALAPAKDHLLTLANTHRCASHPLFAALDSRQLTVDQAGALLKNYDAHASVLRRLLLKVASFMPEPAVGFVLENVRNEYGNGDYSHNHQWQLQDVAWKAGVSQQRYRQLPVQAAIKRFIRQAASFYSPPCGSVPKGMQKAAIAAGAITATEVLAITEFRHLQRAFHNFGLEKHIWFHHVTIEEEHTDDSLALALYFITNHKTLASVEYGMSGVLDANIHLYDGLLAAIT